MTSVAATTPATSTRWPASSSARSAGLGAGSRKSEYSQVASAAGAAIRHRRAAARRPGSPSAVTINACSLDRPAASSHARPADTARTRLLRSPTTRRGSRSARAAAVADAPVSAHHAQNPATGCLPRRRNPMAHCGPAGRVTRVHPVAIVLVLSAAVAHAGWNLFAKRVPNGGALFVWLAAVLAVSFSCCRSRGGRARGTGCRVSGGSPSAVSGVVAPRLLRVAAAGLSGRRPVRRVPARPRHRTTAVHCGRHVAAARAARAVGTRRGRRGDRRRVRHRRARASAAPAGSGRYGLATGALIAAYTLWDAHAVTALAVPPLVLMAGSVRRRVRPARAVRDDPTRRRSASCGGSTGPPMLAVVGARRRSPTSSCCSPCGSRPSASWLRPGSCRSSIGEPRGLAAARRAEPRPAADRGCDRARGGGGDRGQLSSFC